MHVIFFPGIAGGAREEWAALGAAIEDAGHTAQYEDPLATDGTLVEVARAALGRVEGDVHVVAHSFGSYAGYLCAAHAPDRVRSLTVVEPPLVPLAVDSPATAAQIARQSGTFDAARAPGSDVTDGELASRVFHTLYGGEAPNPADPVLAPIGARMRAWGAPFRQEMDAAVIAAVPTLVITGGWDDTYEEGGRALAAAGATHVILPGHTHRPHDHPDAPDHVLAHIAAA